MAGTMQFVWNPDLSVLDCERH